MTRWNGVDMNTQQLEAKLADLTTTLADLDAERVRLDAELARLTTAGNLDEMTMVQARLLALERLSAERTRSAHETRAALDVARRADARELILARLVVLSRAIAKHRRKHDAALDRIAAAVAPEVARLTDAANDWQAARREVVELLRSDLGVSLSRPEGNKDAVNVVLDELKERGADVGALREVRGWVTQGGPLLDVNGPQYDPKEPLDGRTLAVEGVWGRIVGVWAELHSRMSSSQASTAFSARMTAAARAAAEGGNVPAGAGRPSGRPEPVYDPSGREG